MIVHACSCGACRCTFPFPRLIATAFVFRNETLNPRPAIASLRIVAALLVMAVPLLDRYFGLPFYVLRMGAALCALLPVLYVRAFPPCAMTMIKGPLIPMDYREPIHLRAHC